MLEFFAGTFVVLLAHAVVWYGLADWADEKSDERSRDRIRYTTEQNMRLQAQAHELWMKREGARRTEQSWTVEVKDPDDDEPWKH